MWDIETDSFQSFDFASGHGSGAEEEDKESINIMSKAQQAAEIAGRRPLLQYWDPTEPKLLVCETSHIPGWKPSNAARAVDDSKEVMLCVCNVFFMSSFTRYKHCMISIPQSGRHESVRQLQY